MDGNPYMGFCGQLQLAAVTACLAIRFRALYQDQSTGNTCGSTGIKSASKSTGNQDYSQTIGKKQTCSPASKANFSHHKLHPAQTSLHGIMYFVIILIFRSLINHPNFKESFLHPLLCLTVLKSSPDWDYIPSKAGQSSRK